MYSKSEYTREHEWGSLLVGPKERLSYFLGLKLPLRASLSPLIVFRLGAVCSHSILKRTAIIGALRGLETIQLPTT